MYPIYFGLADAPLFGADHEGAPETRRGTGIVLCYPLGHEYIRVHRAFRNLAADLSGQGWPVLRFDYHGTGDSAGEANEMRVARCVSDLHLAAGELKDMSGVSRVSFVGLRLGATIAATAAAQRNDVDTLVAWDPVARGSSYLSQLKTLHEGWVQSRPWTPQRPDPTAPEIIGFPMPAELERELAAIDVGKLRTPLARRSCVIVSAAAAEQEQAKYWQAHLSAAAQADGWTTLPPARGGWDDPESAHVSLQPREALDAILAIVDTP